MHKLSLTTLQSPAGGKLGGAGGEEVPAWCPSEQMICREFGLPHGALPGAEAKMFIEQCAIAVSLGGWDPYPGRAVSGVVR